MIKARLLDGTREGIVVELDDAVQKLRIPTKPRYEYSAIEWDVDLKPLEETYVRVRTYREDGQTYIDMELE